MCFCKRNLLSLYSTAPTSRVQLLFALAIVFAFTLLTSKTTEARSWKVQRMRPTHIKKQRAKRLAEKARKQRQRAQRRSNNFKRDRFHQNNILDARHRARQRTNHRNDEGVDTRDNLREEKKRRNLGLANLKRKIQAIERNVENGRRLVSSGFRRRKKELVNRMQNSAKKHLLQRVPFSNRKKQNTSLNSHQRHRVSTDQTTQIRELKSTPLRFSDLLSLTRSQRDFSISLNHP